MILARQNLPAISNILGDLEGDGVGKIGKGKEDERKLKAIKEEIKN
jgi:hypothetical protein